VFPFLGFGFGFTFGLGGAFFALELLEYLNKLKENDMSFLTGKKTYIGIIIAVVPTLAGFFGYTISVGEIAEAGTLLAALADNLEALIATGGALFAWYGRAVTKG